MRNRSLEDLTAYAHGLTRETGKIIRRGSILAKILTKNDDSGRHGVLIPNEAYEFFPDLQISDPATNATTFFNSFDCIGKRNQKLGYKYYQRYPERRITRLNSRFNDCEHGLRLGLFLKAEHTDGTTAYYDDIVIERLDNDFHRLFLLCFGDEIALAEGIFVLREIDSSSFASDVALNDLLSRFDAIRDAGWIESLRPGTTGIGYTFESLMDVKENNDRHADFQGIEIKCSLIRDSSGEGGKINLFQQSPKWASRMRALERIKIIGQEGLDGRYKCHSQVTTVANNLGLWLREVTGLPQIDLLKNHLTIGQWPLTLLEKRLLEKHTRAVFIKAAVRESAGQQHFHYKELVYCEQPSIEQFVELVRGRRIVFEFLMSEKEHGRVRNHGYPWRLLSAKDLSDLFSLRIRLR